ncbi:MAG: hypothetical protein ACFFCP_17205, partial [Promethearchaeota archaeon]
HFILMPNSTDEKSCGIPVRIYQNTGEVHRGMLFYREEGPSIELQSGVPYGSTDDVVFSFFEDSPFQKAGRVDSNIRIHLNPEIVEKIHYSPTKLTRLSMYPPSSNGWLSHVVEDGIESLITIQNIIGKNRKFLTIIDCSTNELYLASIIQSYESNILTMDRDWNVYNRITLSDVPDVDIFEILCQKSPSWSILSKLTEGVAIPNLSRLETMEETFNQLVPRSFPPFIRRQIMAFLAWLETAELPKEDPIDFMNKYRSVEVFRTLVLGHLQCMLDGVEPPDYIRTMLLADRGSLEIPQRPRVEAVEEDPWNLVRSKLDEKFPDWMGRVIAFAIDLQNQGRISMKLPISRELANKSVGDWITRFALVRYQLFMRGHVHKESIGLKTAIYVGGAHRWPHKHIEWSARLGYDYEKPQYIQIMVMPPTTLERVSRIIPTVRLVDWESSSVNLALYNNKQRKWNLKSALLTKSLKRKRSFKQLKNEFETRTIKRNYIISQENAKILDLISWGFYLSSLESERYSKYYGITNDEIEKELETMYDYGVFDLQYFLVPEKLRSICFMAKGQVDNICSMARAFLKYAPSTQVRITNGGASCVIVSRVPEDDHYNLVKSLNNSAIESELSLRIYPVSAYAGYRNDLYSRLLKMNGEWDDDVSGLLDQVSLQSRNGSN